MSTGLLVVAVLVVLGIAALIAMRRRKANDDDGRYLISREGIAGMHVHPSITRATAEQMADLLSLAYRETWPIVRSAYTKACMERFGRVPQNLPRWHTTRLQPGAFEDGTWTHYGVSSGIWLLAVGCPIEQMAEEIHSGMRAHLGDDVYNNHDLYRAEGQTVSGWIDQRWRKSGK